MQNRMRPALAAAGGVALVLVLAGCVWTFGPADPVETPAATPDTTAQTPDGEPLLRYLQELQGGDIGHLMWTGFAESKPSEDEVAAAVRNAAQHPVAHDTLTLNGSYSDSVWALDLYVGERDAPGWDGEDALHFYAGLEEDIVRVFGGGHLPEGAVFLEDETLYQLIRTSLDTPEGDRSLTVDEKAYATYGGAVEDYLVRVPDIEGVTVRRELTGFFLADGSDRLNAEVYCICDVCVVDPPEKAMLLLAGGAYVDSRLRIHGYSGQNYLVTVDGAPVGFASWESADPEMGRGLDAYASKEALIAAVKGGNA